MAIMADIVSKRIYLSSLKESDFSAMYNVWQHSSELPVNPGAVFGFIRQNMMAGKTVCWLIGLIGCTEIIGSCEYNNIEIDARSADIGCRLKERYRSLGYMTEALEAVIEYGFSNMGLDHIGANIKKSNIPSIRLFARLDFKRLPEAEGFSGEAAFRFLRSRSDG